MTDYHKKVYEMSTDEHMDFRSKAYPSDVDECLDKIYGQLRALPMTDLRGFLDRGNAGPNGSVIDEQEISGLDDALDSRAELWEAADRENAEYVRADWLREFRG